MSSSSSVSEWLSLNIFAEPTAWLTVQTAVTCTHGCQISAKHIFMRLSFVSLTLFLARLMALLTSDTLSMVSSNVTTLIGRLACELRLARTTQESHDSHISSGA